MDSMVAKFDGDANSLKSNLNYTGFLKLIFPKKNSIKEVFNLKIYNFLKKRKYSAAFNSK
jgi:hypothetical protein